MMNRFRLCSDTIGPDAAIRQAESVDLEESYLAYTPGMITTIKVSNELRDRLKAQAALQHLTLGEHLAALADRADRDERFARLRRQIAATPPDARSAYLDETAAWDASSGDGLPAEDFSDWPGYAAP